MEHLRYALARLPLPITSSDTAPPDCAGAFYWQVLRRCVGMLQCHFGTDTAEDVGAAAAARHHQRVDDLLHLLFEAKRDNAISRSGTVSGLQKR